MIVWNSPCESRSLPGINSRAPGLISGGNPFAPQRNRISFSTPGTAQVRDRKRAGFGLCVVKDKSVITNWAELNVKIQDAEFKIQNLEAGLKVVDRQLQSESHTVVRSEMTARNTVRGTPRPR